MTNFKYFVLLTNDTVYMRNSSTYTCENCKHLESVIGDSVITCDKIIKAAKTFPTKTIPTTFKKR